MPADDVSSNDSAVIDDDLVQALGFEPASSEMLVDPLDDDVQVTDLEVTSDSSDDAETEADSADSTDAETAAFESEVAEVEADVEVASDASVDDPAYDDIDDLDELERLTRPDNQVDVEPDSALVERFQVVLDDPIADDPAAESDTGDTDSTSADTVIEFDEDSLTSDSDSATDDASDDDADVSLDTALETDTAVETDTDGDIDLADLSDAEADSTSSGAAALFADRLVGEVESEAELFDVQADDDDYEFSSELSDDAVEAADSDLAEAGMLAVTDDPVDKADADSELDTESGTDELDASEADADIDADSDIDADADAEIDLDDPDAGLDAPISTDDADGPSGDSTDDSTRDDSTRDNSTDSDDDGFETIDLTGDDELASTELIDLDGTELEPTGLVDFDSPSTGDSTSVLDLDSPAPALAGGAVATKVATAKTETVTKSKPKRERRRKQVRARKARRVLRHIDPWSILTFSVLFHLAFFAAMLLASVLVWNAAIASGTLENIENLIKDLGDYETYEINGDAVFRAAVIIAGMLTLASSVMVVLLTVVFNLISDLIGGIRITVIEEETVRIPADKSK